MLHFLSLLKSDFLYYRTSKIWRRWGVITISFELFTADQYLISTLLFPVSNPGTAAPIGLLKTAITYLLAGNQNSSNLSIPELYCMEHSAQKSLNVAQYLSINKWIYSVPWEGESKDMAPSPCQRADFLHPSGLTHSYSHPVKILAIGILKAAGDRESVFPIAQYLLPITLCQLTLKIHISLKVNCAWKHPVQTHSW